MPSFTPSFIPPSLPRAIRLAWPAGFLSLLLMQTVTLAADPATQPVPKGLRVLTIGNSFHAWIPPILAEIAKSAGINDHKIAGVSNIGGSWIRQHWDKPDAENVAKPPLVAGAVDVVTLSGVWLPDVGYEEFATLGFQHNPDIRLFVQEYWLPNDTYAYDPKAPINTHIPVDHNATNLAELQKSQATYDRDMEKMVTEINQKLGKQIVFAVPVGQAVLALREKIAAGQAPGLKVQEDLFRDTWGHPTEPIEVLSAYCFFSAIYHRSAVGLPVPARLKGSKTIPADQLAPLNLLLQQLAWDAVTHDALSGVSAAAK